MADYHRMSRVGKLKTHHNRMRAPAMTCLTCETQITEADAMRHAATCTGPREPHPLSEWVKWAEALALGIDAGTLSRWAKSGKVRARGPRRGREYLRRDLVKRLLLKRLSCTDASCTTATSAEAVDTDQGEGIEE